MAEIKRISGPINEYVELAQLHYQYIPVVTDIELWNGDMSLPNSPHVELVRLMLTMKNGLRWDEIKQTRYYKDRMFRVGHGVGNEIYVQTKIMSRHIVLKKILKHGFDRKKSNECPIVILNEPFWKTRFQAKEPWLNGMEIWDGGGRCAIAYVLGETKVPAYIYEDAHPGLGTSKKFKKKLHGVKGLFDGIDHNTKL